MLTGPGRRSIHFMRRLPAAPALAVLLAACAHAPGAPTPVTQSFGDFAAPAGYAHYLACPQDYCLTHPDGVTPTFKVPADKMRFIAKRAIDALPQTRLVYQTHSGGLFDRTETVTIEVIDADEGVSGLVIYGQSDIPGGDADDLKAQMEQWYAAIYRAANA